MSDVIPITAATRKGSAASAAAGPKDDPSDKPPKANRSRRTTRVSVGTLDEKDAFDGFTASDLISGLHGVCVALDHLLVDEPCRASKDVHYACELAQASKVLSSILCKAVHS